MYHNGPASKDIPSIASAVHDFNPGFDTILDVKTFQEFWIASKADEIDNVGFCWNFTFHLAEMKTAYTSIYEFYIMRM